MTTGRNPYERQFLFEVNEWRKKHGEPPLTLEQEDLYLSQAGTLGKVVTSQPTGQAFMAPRRPSPNVEPPNPDPKP